MTVKELIEELEKIEDKSLPVVVFDKLDFCDRLHAAEISEAFEGTEYFQQNGEGKFRRCVTIIS